MYTNCEFMSIAEESTSSIVPDFPFSSKEDERECRVCTDRSDGAHFGIDSCRACAAFFRRSVVMGKKYVCRQGGDNCDINKSVRCMCRKCRMRKCLEAGMLPESVQSKRDPIVPRRTECQPSTSADHLSTASPSENELISRTSSDFLPPLPTVTMSYNSMSENIKPPEMPHLLFKIANGYKQLCAVRKSTELSLNLSSLKDMFDTTNSNTSFSLASSSKISKIHRAQLPAIGEFVSSTFEEFSQFSPEEKWALFQAFVVILWTSDGNYRTYRHIPVELHESRYLLTETTYIDIDQMELFFDDPNTTKISKMDLAAMMRLCFKTSRMQAVRTMQEMQLQEEEYAAILGLCLWNPNTEKITEGMRQMGKACRAKIFHQLHLLYRLNNVENYSERMGEVMMLYTNILHLTSRMKEDMELFNIFDVFKEDPFIYDIIRHAEPPRNM